MKFLLEKFVVRSAENMMFHRRTGGGYKPFTYKDKHFNSIRNGCRYFDIDLNIFNFVYRDTKDIVKALDIILDNQIKTYADLQKWRKQNGK